MSWPLGGEDLRKGMEEKGALLYREQVLGTGGTIRCTLLHVEKRYIPAADAKHT